MAYCGVLREASMREIVNGINLNIARVRGEAILPNVVMARVR